MRLVLISFLLFASVHLLAQSPEPSIAPAVEAVQAVAETPPEWLVKSIDVVSSLPIVGPYVVVFVKWLGVLSVILTALTAFLLVSINALSKVVSYTKFKAVVDALGKFQNGKIIYWLKFFSLFNAQKK